MTTPALQRPPADQSLRNEEPALVDPESCPSLEGGSLAWRRWRVAVLGGGQLRLDARAGRDPARCRSRWTRCAEPQPQRLVVNVGRRGAARRVREAAVVTYEWEGVPAAARALNRGPSPARSTWQDRTWRGDAASLGCDRAVSR